MKREYRITIEFIIKAEYPKKAEEKISMTLAKQALNWKKVGVRRWVLFRTERNFI